MSSSVQFAFGDIAAVLASIEQPIQQAMQQYAPSVSFMDSDRMSVLSRDSILAISGVRPCIVMEERKRSHSGRLDQQRICVVANLDGHHASDFDERHRHWFISFEGNPRPYPDGFDGIKTTPQMTGDYFIVAWMYSPPSPLFPCGAGMPVFTIDEEELDRLHDICAQKMNTWPDVWKRIKKDSKQSERDKRNAKSSRSRQIAEPSIAQITQLMSSSSVSSSSGLLSTSPFTNSSSPTNTSASEISGQSGPSSSSDAAVYAASISKTSLGTVEPAESPQAESASGSTAKTT